MTRLPILVDERQAGRLGVIAEQRRDVVAGSGRCRSSVFLRSQVGSEELGEGLPRLNHAESRRYSIGPGRHGRRGCRARDGPARSGSRRLRTDGPGSRPGGRARAHRRRNDSDCRGFDSDPWRGPSRSFDVADRPPPRPGRPRPPARRAVPTPRNRPGSAWTHCSSAFRSAAASPRRDASQARRSSTRPGGTRSAGR